MCWKAVVLMAMMCVFAAYLQVHSHQQCVSPRWTEQVTSHDCLLSGFQSYFRSSVWKIAPYHEKGSEVRYRGVGCNGGQLISGGGSKLLEVVRQMSHQWTRKTDRFCIFLEVDVLFRHKICQRVYTTGFSCQNTRSQQISSLFLV